MKAAVAVLAGPAGGGDAAAGRVFNPLAAESEFARRGDEVSIVFHGAGTRWPALLADPGHPFHGLFASVPPVAAGVSDACATVFGARGAARDGGMGSVGGNPVDGVGELASVASLVADGNHVLTF